MGKGSLIPLHYGGRDEHSVIYVSGDWLELEDLLADPANWCRGKQFHFEQDFDCIVLSKIKDEKPKECDWILTKPSTINLIPFWGTNAATFIRNLGLAMTTLELSEEGDPVGMYRLLRAWLAGKKLTNQEKALFAEPLPALGLFASEAVFKFLVAFLHTLLKNPATGFFILEFAIETRVMSIYYFPCLIEECSPKRSYGGFTAATIVSIEPDFLGFGNVHFDMIETHPRNRAKLAMDYLENPQRIADLLSESYQNYGFNAALVKEREKIRPEVKFTPPKKVTFKKDLNVPLPTVTLDGMSTDEIIPVCWNASIRIEPGEVYYMGNLLAKTYLAGNATTGTTGEPAGS